MITPRLALFALIGLLGCVSYTAHAQEFAAQSGTEPNAAPVIADCPAAPDLATALDERIAQMTSMRDNLAAFVSGEQLAGVPPAALFTVNLADTEAIRRRLVELRSYIDQPDTGLSLPSRLLTGCAATDPDRSAAAQQLRGIEAEVNALRRQFLELPAERRTVLLNSQEAVRQHDVTVQELEQVRSEARQLQEQAERSIETAQQQAESASSDDLRELGAQRALVEKTRQELAATRLRFAANLEERIRSYRDLAQRLSLIAGETNRAPTPEAIASAYEQVATIWRKLVDEAFSRIADPERYEPLPALPAFPAELLQRLNGIPEVGNLQTAFAEVEALYRDLSEQRRFRYEEERDNLYRLLLQAGRQRSQLLAANVDAGNDAPLRLSNDYVRDLVRELRVVPLRTVAYLYTKAVDFRHKLESGIGGVVDVAQQLLLLAVLIAIPFAAYRLLRYVTHLLNQLRRHLVHLHTRDATFGRTPYVTLALLIQRSALYLPWIMMLLALWIADALLANTDLAEIAVAIPYIAYYIGYRLFETFLFTLLSMVAVVSESGSHIQQKLRLRRTTRLIGLFFLVSLVIAHATEDVVGRALVYRIVTDLMVYLGLVVCAYALRSWRDEIGAAAEHTLPKSLGPRLKRTCAGGWSWLMCLPTLALVLGLRGWRVLQAWLNEFDIAKRLGAELFRRRVESAVGKGDADKPLPRPEEGLPADYLAWFPLDTPSEHAILIKPSSGVVDDIVARARRWLNHNGENTLAIYGDKGSGKSTLLRLVEHECRELAELHRITVPPKLWTADDVREFFNDRLGRDASAPGERAQEHAHIIFLDEAHNLFLAQPGGFDGYRELQKLLVETASTHFWCATFNRHSWQYLRGVFGSALSWQDAMEIPPFSETDLRQLIMKHHHHSGYELSYDAIISAAQSPEDLGTTGQIETQFFRLLWGQSNGNPRAGLVLWLSSLRQEPDGRLHVSIPQHRPPKGLASLSDDQLFVYAAVVRHENISLFELIDVTQLPEVTIRSALRHAEDSRILYQGPDGRYRVTPLAQFSVTQLLVGRNFLYE